MSTFLWHLALCRALGLPMENNVGKIPAPAHSGQEGETTDNKISEGVYFKGNKQGDNTDRARQGKDILGIWKDLLEMVLYGQRMRNEKELAAMCRDEERTLQAEAEGKEARLAGW